MELSGLRSIAPSRVPHLTFKGATTSKEFKSDESVRRGYCCLSGKKCIASVLPMVSGLCEVTVDTSFMEETCNLGNLFDYSMTLRTSLFIAFA